MHNPSFSALSIHWRRLVYVVAALAMLPVVGILIWQGVTSSGNPDPTLPNTSHLSAILDTSVLVFREGLESILVLAAITAGLSRKQDGMAGPIFLGASAGFLATLATWFLVRGIVNDISVDMSYLALQAATGLLAVVVLLVVMNWFFHKVYWGGWISVHNRQKKKIIESAEHGRSPGFVFWGLVLLGLTSVYREGFEVVLFLQSYYLKLGGWTVLYGSLLGLALTLTVAVVTFWMHHRMPYRKMLIITGVLLGVVLLVMVGEEAYEMQQAGWLSTTPLHSLDKFMPDWAGTWFSLYPNVETVVAQGLALVLVVGSYFISGKFMGARHAAEEEASA
ncbi:MAG TPA: FTR1 family protein [Candidatus Methylacidiphilales bacterium]|nr:FTR1 family protein [Candidatus Methylacidiphilales bacterium]